ncbi:MAG: AEC family transporter [Synergistaceae bacterium]|jgi:predicted permease|nr:AEC family transporter [Synergistaceae bacterium]
MQAFLVVLPIFIMVGIGWGLHCSGLLSERTLREDNVILYWFAMPAILLQGILGADMEVVGDAGFVAAVCLPYFVTTYIVWATCHKGEPDNRRFAVLSMSAARGNHFFVGIPVIHLAMGPSGVAVGTIILAVSIFIMQVVSIGSGQFAMFGSPSWASLRATLFQLFFKTPPFMACLVGLTLAATGYSMPNWLAATVRILADISTGMALISLGGRLKMRDMVHALSVWKIAAFKLVVHPVIAWLIFTLFRLPTEMVQAGVILSAMPVAVNTAIIAQEVGMDTDYCGMGIAVTTVLSTLSLPIWIRALGLAQ